jgi:4-amino-4-deoxy-L-arabinose transferase-like glycosyltransferase
MPRPTLALAFSLYTAFVATLLWSPFFPVRDTKVPVVGTKLIGADSAVFAYVGHRILAGGIPYRDAWDNKPPLVYYLNALELWLSSDHLLGIWLVTLLFALGATWLCYRLCRVLFGALPAALGVSSLLSSLVVVVEYPNLTELYGLPLQFGIFLLFVTVLEKPDRRGCLFALGFLASALLMLRQNIATPLVFCFAAMGYLWSTKSDTWRLSRLTSMGSGFLLGIGIPLGYFALKGSLGLLYEATVRYVVEFGFVSAPLKEQVRSMFPCIKALNPVVLAAAGVLFGAVSRLERQSRFVKWLVVLSTIDFIQGLALSSVPATGYLHYGISWTPALSVLSAYFGSVLLNYSNQSEFTLGFKQSLRAGSAMVVCLIVATNLAFLTALIDRGIKPHGNELTAAVADFVRKSTRPNDQVFVWGAHAEINVLADRASCSRFFYHAALLQPRFFN